MTLYGYSLGFLALLALYFTADLFRMRREIQAKVREINLKRAEAEALRLAAEMTECEAQHLYDKAREIYADAAARWSSLLTQERRVH